MRVSAPLGAGSRAEIPQISANRTNMRSKTLDFIHLFVLLSERTAEATPSDGGSQVNFLSDTCAVRRIPPPGERRAALLFSPPIKRRRRSSTPFAPLAQAERIP